MADTKVSALTADTTPSSDDLIYTVNDPGGTPASRKVTIANLAANMPAITAASVTSTGDVAMQGNVTIDNNKFVYIKDSGGTARSVLRWSGANILNIGEGSASSGVVLNSGNYFQLKAAGTTVLAMTTGLVSSFSGDVTSAGDLTVTGDASLGNGALTVDAVTGDVDIVSGDFNLASPTVPASATATGTAGDIAWDSDYIYICTATDTWKRVAIATW